MSKPPWFCSLVLAALSLVAVLSGAPEFRAAPQGTVAMSPLLEPLGLPTAGQ